VTDDLDDIQRVLAGETEAFRPLVERHAPRVLAIARAMLGPGGAEDAAQDVFAAALEHLAGYDPRRGPFAAWLCAIARHRCLNERRRRRPIAGRDPPPVAGGRSPDAALDEQETFARLDRALAALPAEQRATFVLVELAGLSHEEVAVIEGTARGTVKSRLSRAKERLRAALGPRPGEAP